MIRWTISLGALALGASVLVSAQAAEAQAIGNSRASAIRECSLQSQRYSESTYASLEFELYRACMAERGQVE